MDCPTEYIEIISAETKKDGIIYKTLAKQAQECLSILGVICDQSAAATEAPAPQAVSAADEILKFKQLLDAGVITQEEFNAKKAQLLGL